MVATYTELKSLVADYLNRADLSAQIDTFIDLAEAKFNRDLRLRRMLKTVQATTSASDNTVSLPTDYLEMKELHIVQSPIKMLRFFPPSSFLQTYAAQQVGTPAAFTIVGDDIRLGPTPSGEFTLEMLYFAKIPALSDSNLVNVILQDAPDAYVYGTLLEAEPFLMNDARLQTWASLHKATIESLIASDESGLNTSSTLSQRLDYTMA